MVYDWIVKLSHLNPSLFEISFSPDLCADEFRAREHGRARVPGAVHDGAGGGRRAAHSRVLLHCRHQSLVSVSAFLISE